MRKIALLSAAVLFVPLVSFAQFRVGSDGQAADANTRLGSNGYNSGGAPAPYATGNQIITGNVTGLNYFHGAPYSDPSAFRGQTGTSSFDPFLRQSTAAPLRGGPPTSNNNLYVPQAFYGGQTAAPPPGYSRDPYSGTYVQQKNNFTAGSADINYAVPPTTSQLQLPPPGTNYLVGAPGAGTVQTIVAPLPNGGVKTWQPDQGDSQYFLSRSSNYLQDRPDRKPTDDKTIQQMRSELQQTTDAAIPAGGTQNSLSNFPQPTNSAGVNPTGNQTPPGDQHGQALTPVPLDASLSNKPIGGAGSFQTNQLTRTNLPSAGQQSTQIAELQRRMGQLQSPRNGKIDSPDVSEKPLNNAAAPKAVAIDASVPPAPNFTPTPGAAAPTAPEAPNLTLPAGKKPEPMKVDSLATGFRASGLANEMKSAEESMQQGKFTTAIAKYDTAAQVAPNNGLVQLGKAHAELGGGYYERAEMDLRRAIAAEPALVLGQYNLKSMFGDKRLQFVINDLKQLAAGDKKPARPVLLLAYIAYNTGNEDKAGEWLTAAEQRGAKNDPLIALFRKDWTLPAK